MLYSVTFPNIPILQTIFPCHELGNYIFPKIKKKICIQSQRQDSPTPAVPPRCLEHSCRQVEGVV